MKTPLVAMPQALPGSVERTRVKTGTIAVWHLGGAGLIVKTPGAIIYVDPYVGAGDDNPELGGRGAPVPFDPRAVSRVDAVPGTHDHLDHTDRETLTAWIDHLTPRVFGPGANTELAREWGYPRERLTTLEHGDRISVKDLSITSIRAYDPLAKGANGYLLESQGTTLLHMGDSLHFAELAEALEGRSVDTLFVSVAQNLKGKNWYMTEADAARAARDVGAHTLVPMHWDLWRAFHLDPRRVRTVARWYCPDAVVKIPKVGGKIVLSGRGAE
jgi:L-ascorbate metabolism protein UlaG (beta-lactamase superfamily)